MHSTEAVRAHMQSKGHCKILMDGGIDEDLAEFYDYEDWEEVNDEMDDGISLLISASVVPSSDLWDEETEVRMSSDDTQLILPSGLRLGHRAFNRFWKQKHTFTAPLPGSIRHPEMLTRLSQSYEVMGHDPVSYRAMIQRGIINRERQNQNKMLENQSKKFRLRVGIRGNNQTHYRDQTGLLC